VLTTRAIVPGPEAATMCVSASSSALGGAFGTLTSGPDARAAGTREPNGSRSPTSASTLA
jgi:hypothetical protein